MKRTIYRMMPKIPKCGKERRIDMSDQLLKVLRDHKAAMAADALKTGKTLPEHVFMSRCHKPHELSWVRKVFSNYLKDAGLRVVPFHAIRHFFASVLIGNGASLTYVKEQMGHSSFRITVDTYGHLVQSANRAEVNKLDDVGSWKSATQAQPDPAAVGLRLLNTLINREYMVEEEILRTQADIL